MNIAIYPGSWNPLHAGHLAIAHWAENRGYDVTFELCRNRYDKPPLTDEEVDKIELQFRSLGRKLITTKCISFVQKTEHFTWKFSYKPTFLIGMDTAERICDVKYYFDSPAEMERCHNILAAKAKFLIFPRKGITESSKFTPAFKSCSTIIIDFKGVDISSTQLREIK